MAETLEGVAEALHMARSETLTRRSMIQGFLYGKRHVVRDCLRHPDDQEIFSVEQIGDDYETAHAEMMRALNVAKEKIVLTHLESMGYAITPLNPPS